MITAPVKPEKKVEATPQPATKEPTKLRLSKDDPHPDERRPIVGYLPSEVYIG